MSGRLGAGGHADTLESSAKAPDPASAAKVTTTAISTALKRAHRRNINDKAAKTSQASRTKHPGRPDVVISAHTATVRSQTTIPTVLNEQIQTIQGQAEAHFGRRPATEITAPQPGLGPTLSARVPAESGDDPTRHAPATTRKNHADTNPITHAPGKNKAVMAHHVHNDRLIDTPVPKP